MSNKVDSKPVKTPLALNLKYDLPNGETISIDGIFGRVHAYLDASNQIKTMAVSLSTIS